MTLGRDRRQSGAIWVEITPAEQRVRPGERAVFAIAVENRSGSAQSQSVAVEGLPGAWVAVDFDARSISFPQERRSGTITITVPIEAEGGRLGFATVARAGQEESSAGATLDVQAVEIRPLAPGLALSPPVLEIEAGSPEVRVQIDVRNVGTLDTDYRAELLGLAEDWGRIDGSVHAPAGATVEAELWLSVPRSALEATQPFSVRLTAADFPDVFSDVSGELRVTVAAEADPEAPPELPQRATPPPPSVPLPPDAEPLPVDEDSPVLAPDLNLAPGTTFRFGADRVSEQAILTIQNRSRIRDRYLIEVAGLPEGWYALTATDVSIEAGGSQQVPLRLSPHPGPEYPAGEYQFRLRVAPHGYPDAASEIQALLRIEGVEAFEVRLEPPQASGRTVRYEMTLINTGTRPLKLVAEGSDLEGRCKFQIPAFPEIEAGREATLPIKVGARRNRFLGSRETFDFRIHARPEGTEATAASSFDARFVHTPFLSRRIPVLAFFYALVIGIVLFAILWAPPHVEGFVEWSGCKIHNGPECDEEAAIPAATPTPTAEPTATATTPPTSTATPAATATVPVAALACTNDAGQTSGVPGLAIGVQAFADDRSNIRSSSELGDNRIGQVQLDQVAEADQLAARTMTITGGPVCGPGFTWWQIRSDFYDIAEGWVVELDAEGEVNLSPDP